jgi:3-dehydroquinate synthase
MRTVQVPLGNRSYTIVVDRTLLPTLGERCRNFGLLGKCAVITDKNVGKSYGDLAVRSLKKAGFDVALLTIPAGEKSKSMAVVEKCFNELAAHRLERQSFVVALGGGVVGDLAGFVAATYLRGIPFVQVPTTLLAQVDSSVGGKVGVNLKAGKNLVGAFHQPRHVLCDLKTLDTLPDREFRAGLAEVIKYGIIHDAGLFEMLERNMSRILKRDPEDLAEIVARSCEIKAQVVGQDETESGLRAILNFGHTIGHALEAISRYGKYLHGEAIAIGQVGAAIISSSMKGLPQADVNRIRDLFKRAGLPVSVRLTAVQRKQLFNAMQLDKKVSGGEIKFVLARAIGKVEFGIKVPKNEINTALDALAPG